MPTVGAAASQIDKGQQGFTLLEALVALVVIGILILVAMPAFLGDQNDRAHDAEARHYLAVSARVGEGAWQRKQAYPPLGTVDTKGSLMYELQKNEPELIYGNAVGPKPHYVQVFRVDDDRVTYASQSRSGMVFCLEVVERNVDGLKAGHYWASGPAEADDPCGEDATWGTDPAGNETEGGLPDSPKSDDPEEPGLPDAPDINQDTDPGEDEGEPEAPEVPQEATDPSVPDPPAIIDIDDPNQPFGGAGVISYLNMTLSSNASITGSVATNGYIQLNANAHICGDVQVAPGETVYTQANAGLTCGGEIYNGTIQLPAPGCRRAKPTTAPCRAAVQGKAKATPARTSIRAPAA